MIVPIRYRNVNVLLPVKEPSDLFHGCEDPFNAGVPSRWSGRVATDDLGFSGAGEIAKRNALAIGRDTVALS